MARPLRLLDFPDEILFLVAQQLEASRRSLGAFACVCVRLSEIADPCCYRRLLITSKDQAKSLSEAVQRKPRRRVFMQELMLVPAPEHASEIMIALSSTPEIMHMIRHLMVELPFHDSESSDSFESRYQDRFGDLFEAASLVSWVAKPRALERLRSCKLNFQHERGTPWTLGKLNTVFLHDALESLTLVAAEIGAYSVVSGLRHHKKLTPLSRLHLDHCDVAPYALGVILSIPRALESLELTEFDYGWPFDFGWSPRYAIRNQEELNMALSPQADSLRNLHLGLRFHRAPFHTPHDFCNFTSLQRLALECMPLENTICSPVALENNMLQISEFGTLLNIVWIVFPARPISLVLQMPPGCKLTTDDCQRSIERFGRSLKERRGTSIQSLPTLTTRLMIVRQTVVRGVVPPYLYNEQVPEKVVCYDSLAPTSNWDFETDTELQTEEEIRHLRDATPFPHVADQPTGDFLLGQLNPF